MPQTLGDLAFGPRPWVGALTTRQRAERQRWLDEQARRGRQMPETPPRASWSPLTASGREQQMHREQQRLQDLALARQSGLIAPARRRK